MTIKIILNIYFRPFWRVKIFRSWNCCCASVSVPIIYNNVSNCISCCAVINIRNWILICFCFKIVLNVCNLFRCPIKRDFISWIKSVCRVVLHSVCCCIILNTDSSRSFNCEGVLISWNNFHNFTKNNVFACVQMLQS